MKTSSVSIDPRKRSVPSFEKIRHRPEIKIFNKDIFSRGFDADLELRITSLAITVCLLASIFLIFEVSGNGLLAWRTDNWKSFLEQFAFLTIASFIIYGGLVYQFTRRGYFKRLKKHRPLPGYKLDEIYDHPAPAVAALIPAYKEELRTVEQTLLSAALQQYPNRRVVLLIDDPPQPDNENDQERLERIRSLPHQIETLLGGANELFLTEYIKYLHRRWVTKADIKAELRNLSTLYMAAAGWFERQANNYTLNDHTDKLFVSMVFETPAREFRQQADRLLETAFQRSIHPAEKYIKRHYARLASIFRVKLESFERKQYINLSSEPNKAMNLNSYIALIGKSWQVLEGDTGRYLEVAEGKLGPFSAPKAKYVVTLDADSLLSHDYTLRLVNIMEQEGNERLAVVQTPYTSIPGSPVLVERMAGATTDMQYITHQGFTNYDATYWVGANALLRREALEDIREVTEERGFKVNRYIQDRTVIEDTESSVDLLDKGWRLYNYPQRLSYSATPPDFGALFIQRERWANGGLIIFPKLLRFLFLRPPWRWRIGQGLMTSHYLLSIAAVNLGTLILIIYPFEENLKSFWFPLSAFSYFLLYYRDLCQAGYRKTDLLRVYALNLLLLPVNLAGVFKSIQQGITGKKIPFKRTPKVKGRTTTPLIQLAIQFSILVYFFFCGMSDIIHERWAHAAFAIINGAFFFYAFSHFVGIREAAEDFIEQVPFPSFLKRIRPRRLSRLMQTTN